MTYDPYVDASTWIYSTLTTPAIGGIVGVYEDLAPGGVTSKDSIWVEFEEFMAADDVAEVGEQNIWTEFTFIVQAFKRGRSTVALKDVAAEINDRLHRASGGVTGAFVVSCTRQRPEHSNWTEMGVEYRSLGGIYNLIVQPA
jgi:hypothetical protein